MLKRAILVLCLVLSGCGGLIDSLREESEEVAREADREERYERGLASGPSKRGRGLSANSVDDFVATEGRRATKKAGDSWDTFEEKANSAVDAAGDSAPRRRYNRADFIDTDNGDTSLWNPQGQSNYYFARNNRFEQGDLVVVTIDRMLKREIQYALWKSLPSEQRRIRKKREPASEGKTDPKTGAATPPAAPAETANARPSEAEERAAAEESAKSSMSTNDKDSDMIRMEIVENMGNGLVRLQGQKRVIYRGRPRFIDVSALVRGREIDDQAKTNSQSFLDMRTRVVQ